MAVVIAAILYFIFFGATNTVSSETYEVQGGWKGLIGVASDSIEISVSRYYYNYCFLPTLTMNDSTDSLLGYDKRDVNYSSEIESEGFTTSITSTSSTKGLASYSSSYSGWSKSKVNYD